MRLLILASLTFVTTVGVLACDRPMGPAPQGPMTSPHGAGAQPGAASGQAATCDRNLCKDFCSPARCMFTDDNTDAKCMAVCEARCGDGLFDDQDAQVIACTIKGGHDLSCESPKACCEQQMNTQICAE